MSPESNWASAPLTACARISQPPLANWPSQARPSAAASASSSASSSVREEVRRAGVPAAGDISTQLR
eukprot:scaffold20528_cov132-Isochrysis_galbana.AAC.1